MLSNKHTNHLFKESSPYLLQHANNPVNWYPWGNDALEKARIENKMLLISVGYSACHWCHVMEHECFENEVVAAYMNQYFVSIKVDREERPDIDQVYMNAVQLLTGRGGWPLNVFALPDGKPVYGGTYFPKAQWMDVMRQLVEFSISNPQKLEEQANALTNGVIQNEITVTLPVNNNYSVAELDTIFNNWEKYIDTVNGGHGTAPKFPMPAGYQFLLHYAYLTGNKAALNASLLTLDKMAAGGIYDQIGGGFARYSTDAQWKVPHFEKMLYDNAQLVSLYASAFQLTGKKRYREVVYLTLDFVQCELYSDEGGFYSALDADSEGVEGKFYVWTLEEVKQILGEDSPLYISYYNLTGEGNWEDGINVLINTRNKKELANEFKISITKLNELIIEANRKLYSERKKRIRPYTDDKILTAWNALMLKGYVDAYRVFDEQHFLDMAMKNVDFLLSNLKKEEFRLDRNYKNGKSTINGFLDDYAFIIDALIALYQATFKESFLSEARGFLDYCMKHFFDEKSGMFFYTSDIDPKLIARKMELSDNVIPSSNSVMAKNLYLLGHYFGDGELLTKSKTMLANIQIEIPVSGVYYANWCILMAWMTGKPFEVAITGDNSLIIRKELDKHYLPDVFLSGGKEPGILPLLQNKFEPGKTTIYVCKDKTCKLPVYSVKDSLEMIKN
jgi:uncharacterized protein YyaL (SSP411 family)